MGRWNGAQGAIANSIADYEIHAWLQAIQNRGPSIWIIVHACHSGTICRGVDDEVCAAGSRRASRSAAAMEEAQQKAAQRLGIARWIRLNVSPLNISAQQPTLVAVRGTVERGDRRKVASRR